MVLCGIVTAMMISLALSAIQSAPGQTTAPKRLWEPVGLCGGGGLKNPAVSPDGETVLVESDMGGKYLSHDGGATWTMINHAIITSCWRAGSPLFHPRTAGKIYSAGGPQADAIYLSADNGKNWQLLPPQRQPKGGIISRFYVDVSQPERLMVGTQTGKLLITEDDGLKWREAAGLEGAIINIAADSASPAAKRVYFVGTSRGVYRSDDDGASFAAKTQGLRAARGVAGFAGASDGKATMLYAAVPCELVDGKLAGGVYISKDKGESWQRAMNPKINVQTTRTSEWAPGSIPQYRHCLAADKNPMRAYVFCWGTSFFPPNHTTCYRTDDGGASWTETFFPDPRMEQFNVGYDWMTSFRGKTYVGGPGSVEINHLDPDFLMRTDGMFMFITRDGGKNWSAAYAVKADPSSKDDKNVSWRNNGLVNTTTWHYYIDPHEPRRHYIAYTDIGFARSFDAGKTWRWWGPGTEDIPVPSPWNNTCYELAFDPDIPGRIWGAFSGTHDIPTENVIWRSTRQVGGKGGVCLSTDFGTDWKVLNKGLPDAPATSLILDPKSPKGKRTLYLGMFEKGVFKSNDDGQSWTDISKGLSTPDMLRVCRLQLHPDGTLFAMVTGMRTPAAPASRPAPTAGPFKSQGVGLYRLRAGAESWELVNKSQILLYPRDFALDPADSKVIYIGAADAPSGDAEKDKANPQGGLYRTLDGGATWTLLCRKRATHFGAALHPKHPGWIYGTGCGWSNSPEGSLWLSKDNGKTWLNFPELPFSQIHRVNFDPADDSVIYLTTFGGSVWKGPAEP